MCAYYLGSPLNSNRNINDPLAVIYNQGQWRLNKVTALYNLHYEPVKLKQYSSKIKQTIVSMVTGGASIKYTVNLEQDNQLKYSEEDADALLITIVTSQAENSKKSKQIYEGILLSWGVFDTVPDSIHLPFLLERGEQKVGSAVKSALSSMFDCTIKQFSFNQNHLLQFGFNFIECETSHTGKAMAFTYSSPLAEHKDKLTLKFAYGDVHLMWNSLKGVANSKTDLISLTYQALQNQIHSMFMLDITCLDLDEITLPQASIKNIGCVKMKTPEVVNSVLTVLNEIN